MDFRVREFLRQEPGEVPGTVPLVYPHNLRNGFVEWPRKHAKKASAIVAGEGSKKSLTPNGVYVLVKRFSAKEEKRRMVAAVYDPERLPDAPEGGHPNGYPSVGFENHLNYYHQEGEGLPRNLARGLAAFLNSTLVDLYFRQFSGHTQVNATDLKNIKYPSREELEEMGTRIADAFGDASPGRPG